MIVSIYVVKIGKKHIAHEKNVSSNIICTWLIVTNLLLSKHFSGRLIIMYILLYYVRKCHSLADYIMLEISLLPQENNRFNQS